MQAYYSDTLDSGFIMFIFEHVDHQRMKNLPIVRMHDNHRYDGSKWTA